MKRVVLAALVFGLGALAYAQGYFIGAEIIPHTFGTATYGIPYLTIGYDAGWGYASLGLASPGRLNTWLSVSGGGSWPITTQTVLGGGLTFWLKLENFAIADSTWAVNTSFLYRFGHNLGLLVRMHIPLMVDPNSFLFGSWFSFGLVYYIWSGAPGN
ncbi:MAG: hypothetical protein QXX12_01640 [Nanopusillaceae archaeon]